MRIIHNYFKYLRGIRKSKRVKNDYDQSQNGVELKNNINNICILNIKIH